MVLDFYPTPETLEVSSEEDIKVIPNEETDPNNNLKVQVNLNYGLQSACSSNSSSCSSSSWIQASNSSVPTLTNYEICVENVLESSINQFDTKVL